MPGAILSGILAALSLPALFGEISLSLGPLAWFSLIPVTLRLADAQGWKRIFTLGFVTGCFLYGLSLYWIFIAMHLYGEVSIAASLAALLALVGILSIYLGAAFLLAAFLRNRGVPLAVAFAASWVLQDWVRNFFPFGGFSWSSLAYGQGEFLPLIQIADLTGPYGITFLILLANGLFGEVARFFRKQRSVPSRLAAAVVVLLAGSLLYGVLRMRSVQARMELLPEKQVLLVQGNVPQDEKWLSEQIEQMIHLHLVLSEEAEAKYHPDLVIWPEAAYTAVVPPDVLKLGILDTLKTPLLMGAVSYEGEIPEDWPPPEGTEFRLYNGAFLIEPGGFIAGQYRKNHLVPMGEYVPFERYFSLIEKIVPGFASFTPGEGHSLLMTDGMKFGVTICYEDLFPEISRKFSRAGADFLVNLTNDAWYERSSAIPQHAIFSQFRAIENRRYLVRATNTGVTAGFDPTGRTVARAPLFEIATLPATIRLGGPATFYTRFGDIFVGLVLASIGAFLWFRHLSEK